MARPRFFNSIGTVFLVHLLFACSENTTDPVEEVPEVISDRITANITSISVDHDCDPATDNPGDFQVWLTIWQDLMPGGNSREIVTSPRKTISIHSGEYRDTRDELQVEGLIARVPGLVVRVHAFVRELDNGVADAYGDQVNELTWSSQLDCWSGEGTCMPGGEEEYLNSWFTEFSTREDVFNLFNPDDEGCAFDVTYGVNITKS